MPLHHPVAEFDALQRGEVGTINQQEGREGIAEYLDKAGDDEKQGPQEHLQPHQEDTPDIPEPAAEADLEHIGRHPVVAFDQKMLAGIVVADLRGIDNDQEKEQDTCIGPPVPGRRTANGICLDGRRNVLCSKGKCIIGGHQQENHDRGQHRRRPSAFESGQSRILVVLVCHFLVISSTNIILFSVTLYC